MTRRTDRGAKAAEAPSLPVGVEGQEALPPGPESAAARPSLLDRARSVGFLPLLFFVYLGGALAILTFYVPPFQKADEPAHWFRAVSLTNLDLACSKDSKGDFFYPMRRKYSDLPGVIHTWDVAYKPGTKFHREWLDVNFGEPIYRETTSVFDYCGLPAVGYAPSTAGVLLGKPFQNPLVSFYLGRVFGAVFFVLAIIVALRTTPATYRPLVYLYAALPTVLHQVSAISYDVVQLSLFPVLFGYLTKFLTENTLIKTRELLAFLALIWLSINIRLVPYSPLVVLFFALRPANVATSRARYLRIAAGFLTFTVVTTALAALVYLPKINTVSLVAGEINPHRQLSFILGHPEKFAAASYATLRLEGEWLLKQVIGVFGWTDTPYDYFSYYLIVVVAAIVGYRLVERDVVLVKVHQLAAILGAVVAAVGALFVSLYAVWTPVGGNIVEGLQGRYFVGLLPFAAFGLSQFASLAGRRRLINALAVLFVVVLLRNTFRAIDLRFY